MSTLPRLCRTSAPAAAGIVHLGPGAFFRAFNAVYTDEALRTRGGPWGIVAVSLQSDRAARTLRPQGCAYTSVALGTDGESTRVIEAISDVLVARDEPDHVLDVMADPQIKIVSLTITEKGYCHDPGTGDLRLEAPEIQTDLANPMRPATAPGLIVEALARRRHAGHLPFTVLSCDNLPDNGATARRIILAFARARDAALADWIEAECRFPSTMVDRITPATTADDIARVGALTGYHDPACVLHEPFRQWVIEDDFVAGRPAWDEAGAQFVTSVHAHEKMKLRCLNGTHSMLAYLGYLAGYETIAETVADPVFAALCDRVWQKEILPTVPHPEGEDLTAYVASLLARYRNPAIRHRTWQIAMDGSQKLPQRLLGTISDRLDQGGDVAGLCLAVAGWMRYVGGTDEKGAPIDVRDPLADALKTAARSGVSAAETVDRLLAIRAVFPPDLAKEPRFSDAVKAAYLRLENCGARNTVAELVAA